MTAIKAPEREMPDLKPTITISGPCGIGKTTLCFAIQTMLRERFKAVSIISGDMSGQDEDAPKDWEAELVTNNLWHITEITRAEPPCDDARGETFQARVKPWMDACFGPEISADKIERNHRFLEEALELVQANGCTQSEAHQLVDYVYGRDVGEINQEVGGVMVTLAALCLANGIDMHEGGETELARIWTKVEKIRAKQAAKPKHSPLPEHTAPAPISVEVLEGLEKLKLRHFDCEDPWYGCPLSDGGCANEAEGDRCNCGAEKHNAALDAIIAKFKGE